MSLQFSRHTQQIVYAAVISLTVVVVAVLLGIAAEHLFLPTISVLLVLQLALVVVAIVANRTISVAASVLCALAFNYFFTVPRYSFKMNEVEDIINLMVFLLIALLTKAFADSFRDQREALRQAENRSNILLSVSHDLRTPISSIMGALSAYQNYQDKISVAEKNQLIDGALEECHRLHRYIENLLQATKLKFGQQTLLKTQEDLASLVGDVIARFDSPRVSIEVQPPLTPVSVQKSLLEQAIYNVVDNALRFSPADAGVQITLASDNDVSRIIISDHGPGIDENEAQKVFELFYSSRIGDAGQGGSGIGLTVAKGIIDAHGGNIHLRNSSQGCTVEIRLPNHGAEHD